MPSIERKTKFDKSKSIYKKRKKRVQRVFETYDFEKKIVDGFKFKPLTKNLIKKIITQKNIVSISGNYNLSNAIIISQNDIFLVLINFSDDLIFGELGIYFLKYIDKIEILKTPKANLIKHNFNINTLQNQYFNYIKIPNLPNDIMNKIKDYVNINDYFKFSNLNNKNNKELLLFIRDIIDIPCSIYVENIEPELYGKFYDISDSYINMNSLDLNLLFYTNPININIEDIEYISLNIFNRNFNYEKYYNDNININFFNEVLNKIKDKTKFHNNLEGTYIEDNNIYFNIGYEDIIKIIYLNKHPEYIEVFKKRYINNKNIVENIKDFNINLEYSLTYDNNNDYIVDIILNNDDVIHEVNIIENNKDYLTLIGNDSNYKVFKKYIKKIIKNYNIIKNKPINNYINENLEGKCVWLETIFIGWCFLINKINNNNIVVTAIDCNCVISNRTYIIDIKDIKYIEMRSVYFNFINDCYNKYKKHSVLKNYQQIYNDIIKYKKKYFDHILGFEWILDNFYIISESKTLYCSVFNIKEKTKLQFCYDLSSYYKIVENSYQEI